MMFRLPGGVPTRMAAREVSRHRARSVLIALLVALPVAAVMMASVLLASMPTTADASSEFRTASAQVEVLHGPKGCQQPSLDTVSCPQDTAGASPRPVSFAAVERLGESFHSEDAQLPAVLMGGAATVTVRVADLTNPRADEWFHQPQGNPGDDQVAITAPFSSRTGLLAGNRVTIAGDEYTISQVLRTDDWNPGFLVGPGHPLARAVAANPNRMQRSYLYGPEPTLDQAHALNAAGLAVVTRSGWQAMQGNTAVTEQAAQQSLAIGLGLAVGALAATIVGAAFAIGVQQQRRSLALLAATGAPGRVLQRVVVAQGVVLGAIGAALGAAVGTASGVALHLWFTSHDVTMPTPARVLWPVLLGALLLGVLVSTLAAWLPSRHVARTDVLASVREATAAQPAPRRPLVGLLLAVAGVVTGLLGSSVITAGQAQSDGTVPVEKVVLPASVGLVLAFVGLLLCLGWILHRLGRIASGGPLAIRMALRDGARNRGRAVACTAAALAAVTLGSSLLVINDSLGTTDVAHYALRMPAGTVQAPLGSDASGQGLTPAGRQSVEEVLATTVGPVTARAVQREAQVCEKDGMGGRYCANPLMLLPVAECGVKQCTSSLATLVAWSPDLYRVLTGVQSDAAVQRMIDAGGVVTFDPGLTAHGKVSVDASGQAPDADPSQTRPVELAGMSVQVATHPDVALAGEATLRKLAPKAAVSETTLLLGTGVDPSADQAKAFHQGLVKARLGDAALATGLEEGPHSGYLDAVKWLALGATGLALAVAAVAGALSLRDARSSQAGLAAIGASTRTLRGMAAVQAFVVTGLGGALGAVLALGTLSLVFLSTRGGVTLGVPWGWLALLVFGVPLLTAAVAWLVVRPPAARAVRVD